jgi:hypothetical protein
MISPVERLLIVVAALAIIAGAAMYVDANSKSGCFLGYCGTVIKTPG